MADVTVEGRLDLDVESAIRNARRAGQSFGEIGREFNRKIGAQLSGINKQFDEFNKKFQGGRADQANKTQMQALVRRFNTIATSGSASVKTLDAMEARMRELATNTSPKYAKQLNILADRVNALAGSQIKQADAVSAVRRQEAAQATAARKYTRDMETAERSRVRARTAANNQMIALGRRLSVQEMRNEERTAAAQQRAAIRALEAQRRVAERERSGISRQLPPSQGGTRFIPPGQAAHSIESERSLLRLQSAASGVMIGMAALERSVMGVGFGLIFLRFSQVPVVALFAAMTIGVMSLVKALGFLNGSAREAGREMEDFGQRTASYFQSAEIAMGIERNADAMSRFNGISLESGRQLQVQLQRAGLNQEKYRRAILDTAAATGEMPEKVAEDFRKLFTTSGGATEAQIKAFAEAYDINVKNYGSSLELADAMSRRFANAQANYEQTQTGMLERMRGSFGSFRKSVGIVWGEVIKTILPLIIAFAEGLLQGFEAAKKMDEATGGEFSKSLISLAGAIARATPYVAKFGYVLGTVTYKAIIVLVKIIKTLISAAISLWQTLKPIIDAIMAFVQWAKGLIDKLLEWLGISDKLALSILGTVAGLWALKEIAEKLNDPLGTKGLKGKMGELDDTIKNLNKSIDELGQKSVNPKVKLDVEGGGDTDSAGDAAAKGFLGGFTKHIAQFAGAAIGGALVTAIMAIGPATVGLAVATAVMGAFVFAAGMIVWTSVVAIMFSPFIAAWAMIKEPEAVGRLAGYVAELVLKGIAAGIGLTASGIAIAVGAFAKMISDVFIGDLTRDTKRLIGSLFEFDIREAFDASLDIIGELFKLQPGYWVKQAGIELAKWLVDIDTWGPKLLGKFNKWFGDLGIDLDGWWGEFRRGFNDAFDLGEPVKTLDRTLGPAKTVIGGFVGEASKFVEDGFDPGKPKSIPDMILGAVNRIATELDGRTNSPIGRFKIWMDEIKSDAQDKFEAGRGNSLYDIIIGGMNAVEEALKLREMSPMERIAYWMEEQRIAADNTFGPMNPNSLVYRSREAFNQIEAEVNARANPFTRVGTWLSDIIRTAGTAITALGNVGSGGGGGINLGDPNLPFHMGGVVPGLRGKPVPIIAHGGERFMGAGTFASDGHMRGGGGGGTSVYIDLRGSTVVGRNAQDELAEIVAGRVMNRIGVNKNLTFHRV